MKSTPCPFCNHTHFYPLNDGRLECTACKRRHSPFKHTQTLLLLDGFLARHTAKDTAHAHSLSLPTVQKYFTRFRHLCALSSEDLYQKHAGKFTEYEEYLFLPSSKQKNALYIIEGVEIMGLSTGKIVYTLLMPDHLHTYDAQVRANPKFTQTLGSYYQWHKISKFETSSTPLKRFWSFLELFMKGFHGVKREYFGAYLKEAEFRFNHDKETQKKLLTDAWKLHEAQRPRAKTTRKQEQPL